MVTDECPLKSGKSKYCIQSACSFWISEVDDEVLIEECAITVIAKEMVRRRVELFGHHTPNDKWEFGEE